MKSVGIITLHTPVNIGSCLQSVATYQYIKALGYAPKIIDYRYPTPYHRELQKKYNAKIQKRSLFHRIIKKICGFYIGGRQSKKGKIDAFYGHTIKLTEPFITSESLVSNPPVFDIYLTGSDQVWNPKFMGTDTTYLLSWAPKNSKKVSYASSMSITHMDDSLKDIYSSCLSDYARLSTRETPTIIKELTGKDCIECLDPTFLLPPAEWKKLFHSPSIIKGKYILCYLLSYMFDPYPYAYQLIEHVKKLTGYRVVIIDGDPADILKGYKIVPNCSPEDFLNLFYNASFVITSSFHGTAFSLNFNKPFFSIINDNVTLDNRQLSLAKKVGIENEVIVKNNDPISSIKLPGFNLAVVHDELEKLRFQSMEYLKNALICC